MSITRAQQAKQLLAQGGRTGFQGGGADLGAGASGMGSGGRDRDRSNNLTKTALEINTGGDNEMAKTEEI